LDLPLFHLIYVISISRQREFIVLDKSRHGFIDPDEELEGAVYDILNDFVATYDLRLNVCCDIEGTEQELTNQLNVDLIISLDPKTKKFVLKGKASSVLMSKLRKICEAHPDIDVVVFKDGDPID
jgi:putative multicomponent Na+:H+ antiporter subunit B